MAKTETSSAESEPKPSKVSELRDILQFFWDLASLDADDRARSATSLVSIVLAKQTKYEADSEKTENANDLDPKEQMEKRASPSLAYTVKRLVKGLASSRDSARQGFALALTEILAATPIVPLDYVLDEIFREHQDVAFPKKKEESEACFAVAFGYAAIVRSNRLGLVFGSKGNKSAKKNATQTVSRIASGLVDLSKKRSYLSQICYGVLGFLLEQINVKVFEETILPLIGPQLKGSDGDLTPELLALILKAENVFSYSFKEGFWSYGSVLQVKNIDKLMIPLRECIQVHPKVHLVWQLILDRLFDSSSPTSHDQSSNDDQSCHTQSPEQEALLLEIWNTIIDGVLFNSSHTAKFLAFRLLQDICARIRPGLLASMLTPTFMRTLNNNMSSDDRYLNKVARHAFHAVLDKAGQDPTASLALASQMIGKDANKKMASQVFERLDAEGVQAYTEMLLDRFRDAGIDEKPEEHMTDDDNSASYVPGERQRLWVVNHLQVLLKNRKLPKTGDWCLSILKFLIVHAFYTIDTNTSAADEKDDEALRRLSECKGLSPRVREACSARLVAILSDLSSAGGARLFDLASSEEPKEGHRNRPTHLDGTKQDGEFWVYPVVQYIMSLSEKSYVSPVTDQSEEVVGARANAWKAIKRIRKKRKAAGDSPGVTSLDSVFELLFEHMLLQLLVDPEESVSVIEELEECYKRATSSATAAEQGDEPGWINVLVDVLVSLLARPSGLIREVVNHAFRALCPHVTKSSLAIILNVVVPKSIDKDADGEEGGVASDDDKDEDEDNDDDDDESDEEDKHDDNEDVEMDEDLSSKKGAKLEDAEEDQSDEDKDGEDDDDSDGAPPATDEEMFRLDKALSEHIKLRLKDKKDRKQAETDNVHFRMRLLDLLEIFLKHSLTSPSVCSLVVPLLDIVSNSDGHKVLNPLATRCSNILKRLYSQKQHPKNSNESEEEGSIWSVIQETFKRCLSPKPTTKTVLPQALIYLTRIANSHSSDQSKDPNIAQRIADEYRNALEMMSEKRKAATLLPQILDDLFDRFFPIGWRLVTDLMKFADDQHPQHLRFEIFNALAKVFKRVEKVHREQDIDLAPLIPKVNECLSLNLKARMKKPRQNRSLLEFGQAAYEAFKEAGFWKKTQEDPSTPLLVQELKDASEDDKFQVDSLKDPLEQLLKTVKTGQLKSKETGSKRKRTEGNGKLKKRKRKSKKQRTRRPEEPQ